MSLEGTSSVCYSISMFYCWNLFIYKIKMLQLKRHDFMKKQNEAGADYNELYHLPDPGTEVLSLCSLRER